MPAFDLAWINCICFVVWDPIPHSPSTHKVSTFSNPACCYVDSGFASSVPGFSLPYTWFPVESKFCPWILDPLPWPYHHPLLWHWILPLNCRPQNGILMQIDLLLRAIGLLTTWTRALWTGLASIIEGTSVQFTSVQSLSRVWLFVTPWTVAHQASLSITNSRNLPKLMSTESVMPTNHLILCHPLLLSPSVFPSIRVFLNESALCIRWPKYWSFSFNINPSNEYSGLIFFSNTTVQNISSSALSFLPHPTCTSIHDYWKNHSLD